MVKTDEAGFFRKSHFFGKFCENPVSRKNLVLQLWTKMLSANQIAVFFDR